MEILGIIAYGWFLYAFCRKKFILSAIFGLRFVRKSEMLFAGSQSVRRKNKENPA